MIQRGLSVKVMAAPVALGQAPDEVIKFLVHLSQPMEEFLDQGLAGRVAVLGARSGSFHQEAQVVGL